MKEEQGQSQEGQPQLWKQKPAWRDRRLPIAAGSRCTGVSSHRRREFNLPVSAPKAHLGLLAGVRGSRLELGRTQAPPAAVGPLPAVGPISACPMLPAFRAWLLCQKLPDPVCFPALLWMPFGYPASVDLRFG